MVSQLTADHSWPRHHRSAVQGPGVGRWNRDDDNNETWHRHNLWHKRCALDMAFVTSQIRFKSFVKKDMVTECDRSVLLSSWSHVSICTSELVSETTARTERSAHRAHGNNSFWENDDETCEHSGCIWMHYLLSTVGFGDILWVFRFSWSTSCLGLTLEPPVFTPRVQKAHRSSAPKPPWSLSPQLLSSTPKTTQRLQVCINFLQIHFICKLVKSESIYHTFLFGLGSRLMNGIVGDEEPGHEFRCATVTRERKGGKREEWWTN